MTGDLSSSPQAFAAGDMLSLVVPDTIDTLADLTISLETLI